MARGDTKRNIDPEGSTSRHLEIDTRSAERVLAEKLLAQAREDHVPSSVGLDF